MEKLRLLEEELSFLGLLGKAREIFQELGKRSALSYVRSSYHLLSKVYHPDLNPQNEKKAKILQQRLNQTMRLISEASDEELICLLQPEETAEAARKRKILVAEDEFGLQELLAQVFTMEGYDVRTAVNGSRGYQVFLEFKPDLVLTDVVMPDISGIELARKIRIRQPKIKIIYISGFFGLRNVKQDLHEEVTRYGYPCLAKPFKMSALLELVDSYLNDRPEANR